MYLRAITYVFVHTDMLKGGGPGADARSMSSKPSQGAGRAPAAGSCDEAQHASGCTGGGAEL